jgi:hypothetical protein
MRLHYRLGKEPMLNTPQPQRWPSGRGEGGAGSASAPNVVPIRIDEGRDPLDSYNPEAASAAAAPSVQGAPVVAPVPAEVSADASRHAITKPGAINAKWLIPLCVFVALAAVAVLVVFARSRGAAEPAAAPTVLRIGHVALNTRPDGATVLVDGVNRGVTPLELDLAVGTHGVVLLAGTSERRLDLTVEAGARVSENVDLPLSVPTVGALEITSEPAGARVSVDGTAVGATPLSLKNVNPARHVVAIASGAGTISRTVDVAAGATASVFFTLAAQGSAATGTLAVESPIDLRILENGQLLGLSNGAPIVLSSGKHQLELVNEGLELRVGRSVTVDGGKSTRLNVPVPSGTLSVNASPWAEVFVDGRSIGTTPLGDVSLPIGSHEVVWRHPQLGERRRTVVVGARTPTRVAMDLTR